MTDTTANQTAGNDGTPVIRRDNPLIFDVDMSRRAVARAIAEQNQALRPEPGTAYYSTFPKRQMLFGELVQVGELYADDTAWDAIQRADEVSMEALNELRESLGQASTSPDALLSSALR